MADDIPDDETGARPDEPYKVGYGKTPLHTRFKPGQSGNPRRGKARKLSFDAEIRKVLSRPIRVNEGGKTRHISTFEAATMQLQKKAFAGNMRALELILDLGREFDKTAPATGDMVAEDEQLLRELLASYDLKKGETDGG